MDSDWHSDSESNSHDPKNIAMQLSNAEMADLSCAVSSSSKMQPKRTALI